MTEKKPKRPKSSITRCRNNTITLRGKAAHDHINALQGALGRKHCDGDKHTAGCGHKK